MRLFENGLVRAVLGLLIIVSQAMCVSGCIGPVVVNESAVAVMLDFSQTFAPYDAEDEHAIREIGKAIIEGVQNGWLQQPVKVQWAAFGDQGLLPISPCGPPVVFTV